MSIMGDNPEWFDDWLLFEAMKGRFGLEKQRQAKAGEFNQDYREWERLDRDGKLALEACRDFWEGFVANAEERADRRKYE